MVDEAWFLAASISGVACALLALVVLASGWTKRVPEVAILGSGLFAVSIFTTGFGLSVTSFAGGPPASPLAASLALPAAVLATLPLLAPTSRSGRAIANRWKPWVSIVLIASPVGAYFSMHVEADLDLTSKVSLVAAGLVGGAYLVRRQVFLFRVSRQPTSLVTAAAVVSLTASTSIAQFETPGNPISWVLLVLESASVFAAAGAIIVGYRTGKGVAEVLRPVLSTEPLAALEVGLSPEVQCFVAALEKRDQITRDHVVRTSAIAMRVAIRAELPPEEVRNVALGALLHDIGKLVVPSDILKKPGSLTDEEFATIKSHPEQGEELLKDTPSLSGVAKYVRSHHERVDGTGYPDGLAAEEITLDLGIISVADAWDAMTNTRQYRNALTQDRATGILRDGAGSQWRGDAVLMLLAEVDENGASDLEVTGSIGRHQNDAQTPGSFECMPEAAAELCLCDIDYDSVCEPGDEADSETEVVENFALSSANAFANTMDHARAYAASH